MNEEPEERCENCFYGKFFDSGYMRCRKFPPTNRPVRINWKGYFIYGDSYQANLVPWDEWCGEWRKRV